MTIPQRTAQFGNARPDQVEPLIGGLDPASNDELESDWVVEAGARLAQRSADSYVNRQTKLGTIRLKTIQQSEQEESTPITEQVVKSPFVHDIEPPFIQPINWNRVSTFYALQEWEGFVESINDDCFVARLTDLTADGEIASERAEIPLEEISEDDLPKLKPRAVFRWAIGYERSPRGTKMRVSNIVFRDLPRWTKSDHINVEREVELLTKFLNT
jgi:hypothetical protein